jgi:hypothetical protein
MTTTGGHSMASAGLMVTAFVTEGVVIPDNAQSVLV